MKKVFVNMLDCMYISEEQLKRKLERGGIDWSKPIRTIQEMDGNWYIQGEDLQLMNLKEFMNLQQELDKKILERLKDSGGKITEQELLNCRLVALFTEVGEFANEISSFKYWKKNHEYNRIKELDEYVDILFFWMSIGILKGYTPEEVQEAYMQKWNENIRRQRENY